MCRVFQPRHIFFVVSVNQSVYDDFICFSIGYGHIYALRHRNAGHVAGSYAISQSVAGHIINSEVPAVFKEYGTIDCSNNGFRSSDTGYYGGTGCDADLVAGH